LTKYGVSQSACTLERIAQATHRSMEKAKSETRVPMALRAQMAQVGELGYGRGEAMAASGWKSTVVTEQRNDSYRPIAVEVDYSFIVIDSRSFLSWAKGVIENAVAS
jgi:hypothetical protein